jgi:hypothetical protein
MMCWHRWLKWEIVREATLGNYPGKVFGHTIIQKRQCEKCCRIQMNKQTEYMA